MEEVLLRFVRLGEDIFDSLDNKNLVKCRKITRTWNSFIEDQKFAWVRIIEKCDRKTNKKYEDRQLKLKTLLSQIKSNHVLLPQAKM